MVVYLSGSLNTVLSSDHKKEIIRYIYNHQVSMCVCVCIYIYIPLFSKKGSIFIMQPTQRCRLYIAVVYFNTCLLNDMYTRVLCKE